MDLGATLCTRRRPACERCPVAPHCLARQRGAVDEFPHRKVRAAKPVRTARLFVVRDPAGRCLLEQRPHKGVWGGLWTPPERPTDTTVDGFCQEFRIPPNAVAATRSGPHFRHTFTHFHLDIEPVFVRLDRSVHEVTGANDVCWYGNTPTEQPELGLSAPAARLLADDPLSLEVEQS
jgi:A/G-specific adenine glycosylase